MREFDTFEQLLHDSLQSDEQPSSDFTAQVMARVAETPQRKPFPYAKAVRAVAGLAACIVVVFLATMPLRWRAGSAAPKASGGAAPQEAADSAVAEESVMAEEPMAESDDAGEAAKAEGNARSDTTYGTAAATVGGEEKNVQNAAAAYDELNTENSGVPTYRVTDSALCAAALAWLEDHGYKDDGGFVLHADDVVKLNEAVPALGLPEGDCVLILASE